MFQCRSFNIEPSDQTINGNYFKMIGSNLLSITADAKMNGNDILSETFTTKALKVVLRITNSTSCDIDNIPSASIKLHHMTDTSLEVQNLDLKNCYQGDLYADFILVRGIRESAGVWTHVKKEYLKDIKIGSIGCHSSCYHCDGPAFNQCILCNNSAHILNNGICSASCDSTRPFSKSKTIIYNYAKVTYNYCINDCGNNFFADEKNVCQSCNGECLTCRDNLAAACYSCTDYRMLYNGICLDSCISPFYTEYRTNQNGYRNYTCVKTAVTSPLTVNIQDFGYEKKVQKNIQIYTKAEIFNSNTTYPISSVLWTQISPIPATDNIHVFNKNSSGFLENDTGVIKIKMSAFNHISETTSIKLKVEVTNTNGDKAIDIKEFFLNDAPYEVGTTFTNVGGTNNKEAMVTNFTINVSQWYDSVDDTTQNLEFRTFFVYNKKNYMITSWSPTNVITVQIPYFIEVPGTKADIQLCVQAMDIYAAMTTSCQVYAQVLSNYLGNRDEIIRSIAALDFTNNENMIKLSNYINFMFTYMSFGEKTTDYPHHASMNYICSYDYQCNYHGVCDKQKSMGRCTCDFGYVGIYCQYPPDVYHIIRQSTSTIIDTIYAQYGAKLGNLYQSEIMFISNVFNGLFVDPDSLADEKYNALLAIMLGIASSPAYSIPIQTEDMRIVLDAMNRLGARIGLEGKKFRQNTGFEISQTLYGVDRNALIDSTQQQLQSAYLSYINTLYIFLQQASKRLNPSRTKVVYTSFNFDVSSEIGYAADFVNKEVNIQSNDAFWKIPATVFIINKEN